MVEEYDVLAADRKKLQAILSVCKAFARSQSADSDQLMKTFSEDIVLLVTFRRFEIFLFFSSKPSSFVCRDLLGVLRDCDDRLTAGGY